MSRPTDPKWVCFELNPTHVAEKKAELVLIAHCHLTLLDLKLSYTVPILDTLQKINS